MVSEETSRTMATLAALNSASKINVINKAAPRAPSCALSAAKPAFLPGALNIVLLLIKPPEKSDLG